MFRSFAKACLCLVFLSLFPTVFHILVVNWLMNVSLVDIVLMDIVLQKVEVVKMNFVNMVLLQHMLVVIMLMNHFFMLVVLVDNLLLLCRMVVEVFNFMEWNSFVRMIMVLFDMGWAV